MSNIGFTLKNVSDVNQRIDRFVASILSGAGANKLRDEVTKIVPDDYRAAFGRGGFQGSVWKTSKHRVDLKRDLLFLASFNHGLEIVVSKSGSVLRIQIANSYQHPRMTESYIAAMRGGIQLAKKVRMEMVFSGPVGGVSRSAANQIFRRFYAIVENEGLKAGYVVRQ